MKRKVAVISLSGGMDSTCLLIHLLANEYDVYGVAFDYGQKHKIELRRLWQNVIYLRTNGFKLKKFKTIKIPDIGSLFSSSLLNSNKAIPEGHYEQDNMKSTVVPNRNAIFSSIIYGYALSISKEKNTDVEIFLGVHSGDHAIYPDCRPEFYHSLEGSFQLGNWDTERVHFALPYLHSNKTEILKGCIDDCLTLSLEFDTILANTNTSYNPDVKGRSSGTSGSDIERIEAFINLGIKDPVPYIKPWTEIRDNAIKILQDANDN